MPIDLSGLWAGAKALVKRKQKPKPGDPDIAGLLEGLGILGPGGVDPNVPAFEPAFPDDPPKPISQPVRQAQPVSREQFGQRSPEAKQLNELILQQLAQLTEAPPTPTTPTLNPIEQVLGIIAGSQGGLPAMQSSLGAPFALASQRAAAQDAPAAARYKARQDSASNALRFAVPSFNAMLDREAALDQVVKSLEVENIRTQGKQSAMDAKRDTTLHSKIAEAIQKGTATESAITEHFLAAGYSAELASEAAANVIQDMQNDSMSWSQKLQVAGLKLKEENGSRLKATELRKIAMDYKDKTATDRYMAMRELQEMGDPLYATLPDAELRARSEDISINAKDIVERTKDRFERRVSYLNDELPAKLKEVDSRIETANTKLSIQWEQLLQKKGSDRLASQRLLLNTLKENRLAYSSSRDVAIKEIGRIEEQITDAKKELQKARNLGAQGTKIVEQEEQAIIELTKRLDGDPTVEGQIGLKALAATYQTALDAIAQNIGKLSSEAEIGPPVSGSGGAGGGSRANRNNNPLNIKASSTTRKYPGVVNLDPNAASDGGNFLQFDSVENGFAAARRLIRGKGYSALNLDQALKRWSNNGYGGSVARSAGLDPKRKISSLNNDEIDNLLSEMARAEGYNGQMPGEKAPVSPTQFTISGTIGSSLGGAMGSSAKKVGDDRRKIEISEAEAILKTLPKNSPQAKRLMEFIKDRKKDQ